ncbi:phage tail protein [Flavobacterium faecale]|uniref:Phage tail protein n=1 Tax=Flavobacterium faecale TaxID=1355330 RepID=A0A2S1LC02_9FLAO|nr:tail fiber protein [Flavobacterium faecale]AWG21283.1 phage tail protein [Flavobacterium faecale]
MFAGNFAPRGWAFCDGQLLAISQNTALFSIIGTTYGGDGRTTFALPDLRGRVPMHPGNGPGLSGRSLGQSGGTETNTLNISQMPSHSHTVNAVSTDGNTNDPTNALPANTKVLDKEYSTAATDAVIMKSTMISPAGGNSSINNIQPYRTVNFIIALQGIFPSRS